MQSVSVCKGCGRTVDTEFLYCPWCGISRITCDMPLDNLDNVFAKMEQIQLNERVKYINKLDAELAAMEKDLDVLALSVEMHR